LSKFLNNYPDIDLTLNANHNARNVQDLIHHQIDGAFISLPASNVSQHLQAIEIFTDRLVLIAPPQIHQLKNALEHPLIHYHEGVDYRGKLDAWLSQKKYTLPRTMQMNTLDSVVRMVSAGLGCSYAPFAYIENAKRKGLLNVIPIPEA